MLYLEPVWIGLKQLKCPFAFQLFFFFYAYQAFFTVHLLLWLLFMNSSHKVWLFPPFQHKFHFSATFSLKMGSKVLFTHLIIILIQYFSVFSFSFQFSAVSKRTLICASMYERIIPYWCCFWWKWRERERVIYTYMVEWFNQNTSKSQRQAQEWEINLFWCKKRKKKKKE